MKFFQTYAVNEDPDPSTLIRAFVIHPSNHRRMYKGPSETLQLLRMFRLCVSEFVAKFALYADFKT